MRNKNIFYALIFFVGLTLPLAFAPFSFSPLAILLPAFLLFSWDFIFTKPKQAFFSGWLFGLGFFGAGVSWVFISIHDYGHAPIFLAAVITALLIFYLAIFIAVQGYFLNKIFPKNSLRKNLLVFPATWVFLEWLRGWFLTGFPWLYLGYSQSETPLRNIATYFGVYGVSFAVALSSALLVSFFITKKRVTKILIAIGIILLWLSSWVLTNFAWTEPQGKKIPVSLIQGNIPLATKWNAKETASVLNLYQELTTLSWQSKLIIWPEAAIPALSWQVGDYLHALNKEAKQHKSIIVTGIIYQSAAGKYYNAMLTLGGNTENIYLKKHLLPFGEFLPFKSYLHWLLNFLQIPQSDFSPGPKEQPDFYVNDFSAAPFICYEIAYPYLVLDYLPKAQILLTISEDSWFGKSIASAQHLEIARMRSLETGRYQLICTNSGYTAIIDATGKIISKAPTFQQIILDGEIQLMSGATFWVRFGHYLLWVIIFSCLIIGYLVERAKD